MNAKMIGSKPASAVVPGRDWWSGLEAIVVLHFIERENDSIEAGTPGIEAGMPGINAE